MKANLGRVRGSMWYSGKQITGTDTRGTIFKNSGVKKAYLNDHYLNTDNGNVYDCTTAGEPDMARWSYIGNIRGPVGETEDSLTSDRSDKPLSARMGKHLYEMISEAGVTTNIVYPSTDRVIYTAEITIENVDTTLTITDEDKKTGTYQVDKSGVSAERTVMVTIGTTIGLPKEGAKIFSISSSNGYIRRYKLYENGQVKAEDTEADLWKSIIKAENNIQLGTDISEEYQDEGTKSTVYKTGNISKVINEEREDLFPVSHVKAVWWNKKEGITLFDFLQQMTVSEMVAIVEGTYGEGGSEEGDIEIVMAGDYNELKNKPSINDVTIAGDMKSEELKLYGTEDAMTNEELENMYDNVFE